MALELRMLGPFEVLVDGAPVPLPPSRKTRALLAWLALSQRPQRRERLCEIFWDVPDDPKGALRWSLSKIRRMLGEAEAGRVRADRATVSLDTAGVEIDADRVLGLSAGALAAMPTEALETLAASFRGGFVEDLALDRCPEFEAWRTALAFEAETAHRRLLALLVERLAGDPARALPHAERLAASSPEDESAAARVQALRQAVRQSLTSRLAVVGPAQAGIAETSAVAVARAPAAPAPAPAAPGSAAPQDDIRYATARDGTRIAWSAAGSGPPLVRAAHWMSHLAYERVSPVWRHWLRELSGLATYLRYDERCNGLSDSEAEDLSLGALVSDLEAVVDAAGLDRFTLLGVSQSCAISIAYALRHPERVQGLILYGGYAQGWRARGDPAEIARREAILVLMRQGWGQDNPLFGQLFASMFVPGATPEQIAQFSELQRRTVTPRNAIRLQNAFSVIDATADLARVDVPTLVMHATGDLVAPIESGRQLAMGIPGARMVELDSANHILLESEPAFGRFIGEVGTFLRQTAQTAPSLASPAARPVAAAADPGTRAAGAMARRRVTVLDAEIVSPLAALEIYGTDGQIAELARTFDRMRALVVEHGGAVIETGPGSLVAAFGAACPSEVHAVDACRAALALRRLVDTESEGSARLRVGIDSGDAVVRDEGGHVALTGLLPRRTRQITQALRSAIIGLSDEAAAAAGGYVSFSTIRPIDLSGDRRGRRVFELRALRDAPSRWHLRVERRLTAFTGRAAEMALLEQCLAQAATGRGAAVFVSGEPGIGKSRLAHEFLGRCRRQPTQTIEAGALEFDRNVPFALIRRLLRSLLGLDVGNAPESLSASVRAALAGLDAGGLQAPVLFALDLPAGDPSWEAMAPVERTHRVREAVRRLVALRARARKLVVVLEDLHWCDEPSLAAVARLVDGLERLPVVLVATARPEFRPEWLQRSGVRLINLEALGPEEAHKLIRRLVGRHPSLGGLRRLLLERTDGTPLMIEETVGALAQSGRLTGEPGHYVARAPIVDVEPVASVMPVIAARISRLGPAERQVLQHAAVIGRDGPLGLLVTLTGLSPDDFDAALRAIERGEFLYELLGGGEAGFTFRHALIRDAAYASIPEGRRRALHGAAFDALSRLPADRREGLVERLAHHAYLAGEWQHAVTWLMRAAERAIERSAYDRAVAALERAAGALEALDPTPERIAAAIDVRMTMQIAYAALGTFEAAAMRIEEACEMAEAAGDNERRAQALLKLAYTLCNSGRLDEAMAAAARLSAHAQSNRLEAYGCEADMAAAFTLLMMGDPRGAVARLLPHSRRFDGALSHERFGMLNTRAVWLKGCIAHAKAQLGDIAGAEAAIAEAQAVAREVGRPQDRNASLQFALQVEIARGPSDTILAEVETVLADSSDEWLFPTGPWLLASLGDAMMAKGKLEPAEAVLRRACECAETAGMHGMLAMARRLLAAVQTLRDDAGARARLQEDLEASADIPSWLQTRMRRVLARTEPDDAAAADLLRRAARQAREAGLLPDEAHCLSELADRLAGTDAREAERARRAAEALRARMFGLVTAS